VKWVLCDLGVLRWGGGEFRPFFVGWGPAKRYMKNPPISEMDVEWPPPSRLMWRWKPHSPYSWYLPRNQNCRSAPSCGFKHLWSTCMNRIPKRVLYMNLGTTRLRGKPRNWWQDEVREDGRTVGEEWQEKVNCREEWKQLLRMARNRHILHMPMEWMNEMHKYFTEDMSRLLYWNAKNFKRPPQPLIQAVQQPEEKSRWQNNYI